MWTSPRNNTVCVFCEKTFQNNGQLRRHLLIHTGERPFRCNSCNYSANQFVHLKTHCLRVHSGDPGSYSSKSDSEEEEGTDYDFSFLLETPKSPLDPSSSPRLTLNGNDNTKTPKHLSLDIGPKILFQTPMQPPMQPSEAAPVPVHEKAFLMDETQLTESEAGEYSTQVLLPEVITDAENLADAETKFVRGERSPKANEIEALEPSSAIETPSDAKQPEADAEDSSSDAETGTKAGAKNLEPGLIQDLPEVLQRLKEGLKKPELSSAPSTPVSKSGKRKRIEGDQIVPKKKTRAQSVDNLEEEEDSENLIQCEECQYTCMYWRSMTAHMKNTHRSGKAAASIQCLQCDHMFKSAFALKIHEKRTHTPDKPYKCKHCSFASVSKQYWMKHERFQHAPPSPSGPVGVKTRKGAEEGKLAEKVEEPAVETKAEVLAENQSEADCENEGTEEDDTIAQAQCDDTILIPA